MKVLTESSQVDALECTALRSLLRRRIQETEEVVDNFAELVRFVVLEAGDDPSVLCRELARDVLTVAPDASEHIGGLMELVYVLSDDGAGVMAYLPEGIWETAGWRAVADLCGPPEAPSGDVR